MPSPQEFEIRPVAIPPARAARTAPTIASSGPRPANSRPIRPSWSSRPRSAAKRGSNAASSSSPVSSPRSSASASGSSRNSVADGLAVEPLGLAELAERGPDAGRQHAAEVDEERALVAGTSHQGSPPWPGRRLSTGSSATASRPGSRENVAGAEPPLEFERISGGRSNLTYGVTDAAGRRWALRRPPMGKRLGSAHDMGREHRSSRRSSRRRCPWRRSPGSARTSR